MCRPTKVSKRWMTSKGNYTITDLITGAPDAHLRMGDYFFRPTTTLIPSDWH